MVRICFVCMGNICRSPTAEGVMRHLVRGTALESRLEIDSAGTGAWHAGEPPDPRSAATARERGIELEGAARQFRPEDFERFDYVLALDTSNYGHLEQMARSPEHTRKLHLLRDFDPESPAGERGFDDVFDIVEAACRGLVEHLEREHAP